MFRLDLPLVLSFTILSRIEFHIHFYFCQLWCVCLQALSDAFLTFHFGHLLTGPAYQQPYLKALY